MKKKSLFLLTLLAFLPAQAVLTDFTKVEKKESKTRVSRKSIQKKINKKKDRKIQDAIVWLLPQREFLGKKLTSAEQEIIDAQALERFILAASKKNPEAYKIYNSKKKNSRLIENLILNKSQIGLVANFIESKNYNEEKQKELVINEIKRINKLYQELKEIYSNNKQSSKPYYQEIKLEISKCCGLENFLYIENLLKREINYVVFNT